MDEKQSLEESPGEFGGRLQILNDALTESVSDSLLIQIFVRGLDDADLKKYLIDDQLKNHITDFDEIIQKCDNREVIEGIVNGTNVDGKRADFGSDRGNRSW